MVISSPTLDVGREGTGLLLGDPGVSRHHLELRLSDDGLAVVDVGSSNGTSVNGVPISGETRVHAGDVIRLSDTEITVVSEADSTGTVITPAVPAPEPASVDAGPTEAADAAAGPSGPQAAGVVVRPALHDLTALETEAAVVRYRPGTAGEAAAGAMASAVRRARKRLAGIGSEPWGVQPQICLVDPFPDPAQPGLLITTGTIVDAARNEIWMVVTPESPPEQPERPLALLFGASLPAAADLELLLEGFGLHIGESPDADAELAAVDLPPLADAEGELRTAMALSFVRFLVRQGGTEAVKRLLVQSRPGQVNAAAEEIFGSSLVRLEDWWREDIQGEGPKVKTGQFLRLTAGYLRPHRGGLVEMFIFMLFGLVFTAVFPFANRRLIDHAIPSGEMSQVLTLLFLLAAAFTVSLLAELRLSYVSARISGKIVRDLRKKMFDQLQTFSARWYSSHQAGDVTARLFSDVAQFEMGVDMTVRDGLAAILSLAVAGFVAVRLNVLLGCLLLAGAPLVALTYKAMGAGAEKRSSVSQEQNGALLTMASENYMAHSVVSAYGLESRERERFARASERLLNARVRMELYSGLFGVSVGGIGTVLRLSMIGVGAWEIFHGHFTLGGLVAFFGIEGQLFGPVRTLTTIGQRVQVASGALGRINELLDTQPEVADEPDATPLAPLSNDIRLDHVAFSYNAERRILDDVSVTIPAGTKVAFVGPTGAGKSSVLQLLLRFYDPDEGAVLFDGRDVRTATLASMRRQIGVVFQETFLFDTTIKENLLLGNPGATDADVEAAARAAEVHEFIVSLPRGYDTLVGERGGRLSGGQRQRMAIARALIRNPTVLVLDEATSALDPRTERLVADTLDRVGQGRTTIAVTHRLASITGYDRIFVLVSGRVVEQGSHDELVALGGVYAGLWAEQTGSAPETAFDVRTAMSQVPLFTGLDDAGLSAVIEQLRPFEMDTGETITEGGRLLVVTRGRARVLVPGVGGEMAPLTELTPGATFGLSALLGNDRGAVLRALEPVRALSLDDDALATLAARYPAISTALTGGTGDSAAAPAGGQRLSTRLSIAPGTMAAVPKVQNVGPSAVPPPAPAAPGTGAFPGVR